MYLYRKIECVSFYGTKTKVFLNNTNQALPTSCRIYVWIIFGLIRRHFCNEFQNLCIRRIGIISSQIHTVLNFFGQHYTKSHIFSQKSSYYRVFFFHNSKKIANISHKHTHWAKKSKKYMLLRHDLIDL